MEKPGFCDRKTCLDQKAVRIEINVLSLEKGAFRRRSGKEVWQSGRLVAAGLCCLGLVVLLLGVGLMIVSITTTKVLLLLQ